MALRADRICSLQGNMSLFTREFAHVNWPDGCCVYGKNTLVDGSCVCASLDLSLCAYYFLPVQSHLKSSPVDHRVGHFSPRRHATAPATTCAPSAPRTTGHGISTSGTVRPSRPTSPRRFFLPSAGRPARAAPFSSPSSSTGGRTTRS